MVSTRGWGHCQTQKVPALPSLWLSAEFGHFSHEPPLTTRETPPPLTMLSLHRLLAHLSHLVTPSTQTSSLSSSQVLFHGLVTCLGHSPKSTGWWQTDGPGPMLEVSCGLCGVRSAVGCAGSAVGCAWEKEVCENTSVGIAAGDNFKNRIQSIFLSPEK